MASAGFSVGDAVQYYSDSHACWIDTTVQNARPNGEVQLICKPGIWITLEDQKTKVRTPPAAYKPAARASQGPWSADQALALGPRSANQLGARKVEELRWASVLDSVTSVHAAVEQLNSGTIKCLPDFCVVYSASSSSHYLLYKKGTSVDVTTIVTKDEPALESSDAKRITSLEASLIGEKEQSAKLQLECDRLRSSYEERLRAEVALKEEAQERRLQSETERGALQASIESQLKELEQSQAALESKRTESEQMEHGKGALEAQVTELKDREKILAAKESEALRVAQERLVVEMEQRNELERQVASFDVVKQGLEKQLCETNAEMDELQNELEVARKSTNELEDARSAKDLLAEKLTAAEEQIRVLKIDISNSDSLNEKLTRDYDSKCQLASTLAEEVWALKESATKPSDSDQKLEGERQKRKEAEDAQEKLLEANEVLSTARRSLEKQTEEDKAQRATLEAEIVSLKGRLEGFKTAIQEAAHPDSAEAA